MCNDCEEKVLYTDKNKEANKLLKKVVYSYDTIPSSDKNALLSKIDTLLKLYSFQSD